jgi:hypothetical protein
MANQYSADVPKGFNVPKQVRLDSITGIQNEASLKNLGPGNSLAFKYYEGLEVFVPAFILVSEPFAGEPPFVTKKKLKDFPE